MLTSLGLLVVGAAVYSVLKGESHDDEMLYGADDQICYFNESTDNYEQEHYYKENLDLRYYMDDPCKGLTTDKYLNAKHAAEVARATGKRFTDKNKTY